LSTIFADSARFWPLAFKIGVIVVSERWEGTMLLINNEEVEKLFSMKDCLEALELGYDDLLKGDAVYRPRLDVWMRATAGRLLALGHDGRGEPQDRRLRHSHEVRCGVLA
jgi:hypothetical protein